MKKLKRFLSALLSTAMVCGLLCVPASAVETTYYTDAKSSREGDPGLATLDVVSSVTFSIDEFPKREDAWYSQLDEVDVEFKMDWEMPKDVTILIVNPDSPITTVGAGGWGLHMWSVYEWNGSQYEGVLGMGSSTAMKSGDSLRDFIHDTGEDEWTNPILISVSLCMDENAEFDSDNIVYLAASDRPLPGVDPDRIIPAQPQQPSTPETSAPTVDGWAKERVALAAELGFVSGIGDGKFGPDSLVTREQMAVMLAKVYTEIGGKIPNVTVTAFADDKLISSWAKSAVDFMNGQKIISGKGDRKFVPNGEGGNAKIEEALLVSLKMFETLK